MDEKKKLAEDIARELKEEITLIQEKEKIEDVAGFSPEDWLILYS